LLKSPESAPLTCKKLTFGPLFAAVRESTRKTLAFIKKEATVPLDEIQWRFLGI
jgi:hypothetical protein